ncbi:sensor histidine kinase [Caballeronia udeis]|uniref:sensor histidine kinase n=1 Tax=Caballeronia udeis TaxID=1232866 RepID=UPI0007841BE0|nr:sensor histidine kinase [Caballeronia udeis]
MLGSLRARLLGWLLLPLTVFVCISGIMSLQNARSTANLLQDNTLISSMRIIGEDIDWDNGEIVVQIPPASLELFESPERDNVFYKIVDGHNRLLAGNPDLPLPDTYSSTPAFYNAVLNDGRRVRAAVYVRPLFDSGRVENITVAVAKTEFSRDAMVADQWRPQLVRLVLMLLLAMLLVYFGLTFELRPLMKLKDDVSDRAPSQLQPIRAERLHFELRPIVDAINQCISRMSLQAATQRQFISDAAHQLRTPLTLLDTQIQFARQRPSEDEQLAEALAGMHKSSRKMAVLTSKLLLLAHTEFSQPGRGEDCVDLSAAISGVLGDLVAFAQQKDIDLGAEISDDMCVAGDETLMTALLTNLVDNALRYTQRGGWVTVTAQRSGASAVVQVIDNGPGISAEARSRVFERFYRVATDTEGSGLGLSIVREIANRHGGTVTLTPGKRGVGLLATVTMPLWCDPVSAVAEEKGR